MLTGNGIKKSNWNDLIELIMYKYRECFTSKEKLLVSNVILMKVSVKQSHNGTNNLIMYKNDEKVSD